MCSIFVEKWQRCGRGTLKLMFPDGIRHSWHNKIFAGSKKDREGGGGAGVVVPVSLPHLFHMKRVVGEILKQVVQFVFRKFGAAS